MFSVVHYYLLHIHRMCTDCRLVRVHIGGEEWMEWREGGGREGTV